MRARLKLPEVDAPREREEALRSISVEKGSTPSISDGIVGVAGAAGGAGGVGSCGGGGVAAGVGRDGNTRGGMALASAVRSTGRTGGVGGEGVAIVGAAVAAAAEASGPLPSALWTKSECTDTAIPPPSSVCAAAESPVCASESNGALAVLRMM